MLNYDWSLSKEAVDAVGVGSLMVLHWGTHHGAG